MGIWNDLKGKRIRNDTLQELLRYGFWGVVTTLINFFSYWALLEVGMDYRIANLISMLLTKTSAYIVNKFFVFRSKRRSGQALAQEIALFIATRGASGVVEYAGLIFLVDLCHMNRLFGKGCMLVFITTLNYIFGKKIVYKEQKAPKKDQGQTL